jgi:DNA-binding PadR family transcriptional regulator
MKHAFLALLAHAPSHGYDLRLALEQRFGALLPPVNAGQIYTTLQRLERDGLITGTDVPEDSRNKRVYELTQAGRDALERWIETPAVATRLKDDFFMKLVLAGLTGIADAKLLIDRQRREYLQTLRDLDELAPDGAEESVAALLVEGAALHLEADLRWLEACEQRLFPEGGR